MPHPTCTSSVVIDLKFFLTLLGFTGFLWVLLGFTGCYWVLYRFEWVSMGFTGFYWILLVFSGCWGAPCSLALVCVASANGCMNFVFVPRPQCTTTWWTVLPSFRRTPTEVSTAIGQPARPTVDLLPCAVRFLVFWSILNLKKNPVAFLLLVELRVLTLKSVNDGH